MSGNRKVYEFILEAGIKLNARSTTCACAAIMCCKFLHKLPTDVSEICPFTAASACLFLAGKAEEDFLKIRDITNVCYRVLHPREDPLEVDELFWDIRDGIGNLELLILRTLGFHLSISHPHKYLLHYLKSLKGWIDRDVWDKSKIAETAWAILRDSYVSPGIILRHSPQVMALAVLNISLRSYGISVPYADTGDRDPWWKVLYSESSPNKLHDLSREIIQTVYNGEINV